MTSLTLNEQSIVRTAKSTQETPEAGQIRSRGVFAALRRWLNNRQMVAQLQQMDDRMLRDIGIERGDIVARIYGRPVETGSNAAPRDGLIKRLSRRLAEARRRRQTVRILDNLSDRMLDDIGIVRADIEKQVGLVMAGQTNAQVLADLTPRRDVSVDLGPSGWGRVLPHLWQPMTGYFGFEKSQPSAANNERQRASAA